jgi:hypothetical protein
LDDTDITTERRSPWSPTSSLLSTRLLASPEEVDHERHVGPGQVPQAEDPDLLLGPRPLQVDLEEGAQCGCVLVPAFGQCVQHSSNMGPTLELAATRDGGWEGGLLLHVYSGRPAVGSRDHAVGSRAALAVQIPLTPNYPSLPAVREKLAVPA